MPEQRSLKWRRTLPELPRLTVVTNALNVALTIASTTEAQVILLGGTLSRTASSTVGPLGEQSLADLSVGKVFPGSQALDLDDGLSDTTLEIAQIKP